MKYRIETVAPDGVFPTYGHESYFGEGAFRVEFFEALFSVSESAYEDEVGRAPELVLRRETQYPSRRFLLIEPNETCRHLHPLCVGLIYVFRLQPTVFGTRVFASPKRFDSYQEAAEVYARLATEQPGRPFFIEREDQRDVTRAMAWGWR